MKKLFFAGAAALMLVASACNNGTVNEMKTQEDSLAYYFGQMWGNGVGTELKNNPIAANFDKAQVLKGMKAAMTNDTTKQDYMQGLQIGIQLNNIAQSMAKDNIELDLDKVYTSFEAAFTADSIGTPDAAQAIAMDIINKIKRSKLAESPEAIANKGAGEKYIADKMAEDASFKKTESGLVYKVINEGKGELIKATDRVKVKYVGKHIDGTEFDNSGDEAREFSPTSVVPGFGEGLQLMKAGAHFMLIIPGELGYGLDGQPYANIESNETLVFDVEVVEIVK